MPRLNCTIDQNTQKKQKQHRDSMLGQTSNARQTKNRHNNTTIKNNNNYQQNPQNQNHQIDDADYWSLKRKTFKLV